MMNGNWHHSFLPMHSRFFDCSDDSLPWHRRSAHWLVCPSVGLCPRNSVNDAHRAPNSALFSELHRKKSGFVSEFTNDYPDLGTP